MRQLVQLQKNSKEFDNLNAELVFVYREEAEGVEGLKKINEKVKPPYRLALDFEKKSSKAYSPKNGTFNNYVIDSDGIVRGIVDGTLRDRATAEELMKILGEIESDRSESNVEVDE